MFLLTYAYILLNLTFTLITLSLDIVRYLIYGLIYFLDSVILSYLIYLCNIADSDITAPQQCTAGVSNK